MALYDMGEYQRAMADYNKAIALVANPNMTGPYYQGRGLLLYNMGEYERAVADYNEALRLDPGDSAALADAYFGRGNAYYLTNRPDLALTDYKAAWVRNSIGIRDASSWPEPWGWKAKLLATCSEPTLRDSPAEAVVDAHKAADLTHHKAPEWLDILAAAYAENGDFDQAMQWERQAISRVPVTSATARKYAERLKLYQQSKPYRANMR